MNSSALALGSLVIIIIAWVGLSFVRGATARYFRRVAESYEDYYSAAAAGAEDAPPPAKWNFRSHELEPISPDDPNIRVDSSGMAYGLISEAEERQLPLWIAGLAVGKRLLDISPVLFHSIFAVVTLLLAFLWWRLHSG